MPRNENFLEHVPERWRDDALRMAEALRNVNRVIVSGHVNPDGDALGAVAAFGCILRFLGKEFVLYSATGVYEYLRFLPLPGVLRDNLGTLPFVPAAALVVDCSEAKRVGGDLEARLSDLRVINIDHHLGEPMPAAARWIEPSAAATAQLAAYVGLALGMPPEGDFAQAVMLGLITDTGGFAHGNTSADVLRLSALLVENGCDLPGLRERIESSWSMGRLRLWVRSLDGLRCERDGSVGLCTVTLDDLRRCGARKEDCEGIVDQIRRLRGVRMAALLREDAPGVFKLSMRSSGATSVRDVATRFGGGGHRNAAGGLLNMPREEAERAVLAAAAEQLDKEESARSSDA